MQFQVVRLPHVTVVRFIASCNTNMKNTVISRSLYPRCRRRTRPLLFLFLLGTDGIMSVPPCRRVRKVYNCSAKSARRLSGICWVGQNSHCDFAPVLFSVRQRGRIGEDFFRDFQPNRLANGRGEYQTVAEIIGYAPHACRSCRPWRITWRGRWLCVV